MPNAPKTARRVDHLVLPVHELGVARARYEQLGFNVAPDALHPFGTENACVYFADGTYLEPLGIHKREDCEAAAIKGNVFIARDQAFRFRRGEDGFSAVAFTTGDAQADQKRFTKLGISAGKPLNFSRVFTAANGRKSEASFRLSYAADLRAPDVFLFTCERINAPKTNRSALVRHENHVTGIAEIAFGEPNPSDFQYFLQDVIDQRHVNAHSFGIEMLADDCNIAVYSAEGLEAWFGIESGCHGRGLRARAFSLKVPDLKALAKLLKKNKVAHSKIAHRIVVPPAPGQGCVIAFEEA